MLQSGVSPLQSPPPGAERGVEMAETLLSFDGRINRRVYWMLLLFIFLGYAAAILIDRAMGSEGVISTLFLMAVFWPFTAIQIKRWHDTDKSGWWVLVHALPVVGTIVCVICNGFMTGTRGSNRFGTDPLLE